ncbi:MAG TPA: hypothetical protein VJG83_06795 [archaeon]|nr:hypothetical protein [archaeon]
MPGRLKSTKGFRDAVRDFRSEPRRGELVARDGRVVRVSGPKNSLILKKDIRHVKAAEEFYHSLRRMKFDHLRIVPVKIDKESMVQKYFHRPSLAVFISYLSENRLRRVLMSEISATDREFCEKLVKSTPNINERKWLELAKSAKGELMEKARVSFRIPLAGETWVFGFSNFIVFGLDSKGVPKVGLVDV